MRIRIAVVLLATFLAGCLGDQAAPRAEEERPEIPWGVHPWPRGDEWPPELTGPFKIKEVLHQKVASFDQTPLDGWIVKPDVPEGTRVPVVLWSSPYFGQCAYVPPPPACNYAIGSDPALYDNDKVSEAVPVRFLLEHGYAVAIYNVRGTGNSGGCFEWFGPKEHKDQKVLVDYLALQPWSNGRIGMMGLSYHGTTPWEAAIQNPEGLKTIVVAGMVSDPYTFSHTPQGAKFTTIGYFNVQFALRVSLSPPINGPAQHFTVEHAPVMDDRVCPDVAEVITEEFVGAPTDLRNARYWNERRIIDQFPNITASVFLTHGFLDLWGSGHQQQENAVWPLLQSPKRQLEGQWGHEFPNFNTPHPDWRMQDWNERLLGWLDFWLKGVGSAPPREGIVDYQDNKGDWHETTHWPPADSHQEVLYLAGAELAPQPSGSPRTFRSVPTTSFPREPACPQNSGAGPSGLFYKTKPVENDTMLAGNPMAYLRITSDRPGGLVAAHLYDVAPGWPCASPSAGLRRLGAGVADLRFHAGNFRGKDFPTGQPTPIRVDITNFAEVLPTGHSLGVLVSYGDPLDRFGQPFAPQITVHADGATASHLVLPIVDGSLGGAAPTLTYPPRPFVPVVP